MVPLEAQSQYSSGKEELCAQGGSTRPDGMETRACLGHASLTQIFSHSQPSPPLQNKFTPATRPRAQTTPPGQLPLFSKSSTSASKLNIRVTRKCLGQGAFGSILLGVDEDSGRQVACKEVSSHHENADSQLLAEITLMSSLAHPNIVSYLGWVYGMEGKGFTHWMIIMELCPGGSLQSQLKLLGSVPLNMLRQIGRGCVAGLVYLHQHSVIHRDIKPGNILLTTDGEPK
eukprot:gene13002-biopygen7623